MKRAFAAIDLDALRHNYQSIQQRVAPQGSKVMAVVKANAYGHSVDLVATALADCDGFGVATLDEAAAVRKVSDRQPLLLLEGVLSVADLQAASELRCDVVVHNDQQLAFLNQARLAQPIRVWLKVNTGMHRLGFECHRVLDVYARLHASPQVSDIRLMTHFACADDDDPQPTLLQQRTFAALCEALAKEFPQAAGAQLSLCNSAALLNNPESHCDWVRPGLALYGGSPLVQKSAAELGLRPVMTLYSQVIALRHLNPGERVGYGGTWQATEATPVAIVSIGYGDGYPRHVDPQKAVVRIGEDLCPLVGRVSMDMIAVSLQNCRRPVNLGDLVVVWGDNLPVETIADAAGTLNYELLCQVTGRVPRIAADVLAEVVQKNYG